MQISKDKLKLIRLQRISLFVMGASLFLQFQITPSMSNGLSAFNQIFLLTKLQSKILLKNTIPETGEINSVAISRDGQTIVSRSKDNTIKVRNLKTGNVISTIAGNPDEKRTVLISPDLQTVARSSKDGIQILDLKTGLLKTTLYYKGKEGLNAFAFSPDGQTLVSSSLDRVTDTEPYPILNGKPIINIEIWNLSTGKLKTAFPSEDGYVNLVAISPDGQAVVSSGSSIRTDMSKRQIIKNNTIKIWDVKTGQVKTIFSETVDFKKSYEKTIDQLTISPDGQTFVTLSGRKTVKLWDMNTGSLKTTLPNPKDNDINSIVFSPDGQTLFTSNWGGIKLWNLKTSSLKTTLNYGNSIGSFAISQDGQTLVGKSFSSLIIWDLKTGKYKTALVNSTDKEYVSSVAISPDGQTIVSNYWNWESKPESIKIWQMP